VEKVVAISFAVLGSGSAGNSTVVVLEGEHAGAKPRYVLIDAGLSPLATRRRLASFGIALTDISAILVTHFDRDHFGPTWAPVIEHSALVVYAHHQHRRAAAAMIGSVRRVELVRDSFQLEGLAGEVRTMLAPHDEHGTVSFRIEHRGASLGFATDLGRATSEILDHLAGVDGLAIESNYDPDMQRRSGRPAFLKKRIMGGLGHLSNEQSFEAVCAIACSSDLQHVAALHLSRQCNDPRLVRSIYARELPAFPGTLTVSSQAQATPMLRMTPGRRCVDAGAKRQRALRPGEQHVLF
jgi:phosphoribosyl 1,2-cyclic phosphodiesterase